MTRPATVLGWPIRAYQWASAGHPPTCRYWPTCSTYALRALEVHGAWRGACLAGWRVLRCHPWSEGGVDEVPARRLRSGAPNRLACG